VTFAAWCIFDLSAWFAFLGSKITMFTWSLIDLFALIFFFFSYYFLYTFITKHDLPFWQKSVGGLLLLPTAIWTFFGSNLIAFESNFCEALEHETIALYPYFVQGFFLIAVIALAVYWYHKAGDRTQKKEILLSSIGVSLFLGFFFLSTLGVNLLINYYESWVDYAYNFEIYGLFGMPVLLVYLGYLIVRYRAFDLRIFNAQALAISTIAIVAAQYAFLNNTATFVLNSINLILVAIVSISLAKNVKKEIELRKEKEALAVELEAANKRQQETLRFITHEVKGYLTDGAAALDAMLTGMFGAISDDAHSMLAEALTKNRNALREIQNFLRIADFKTGKVAYAVKPFDFKKELEETLVSPQENAKTKGLTFTVDIAPGDYTTTGDSDQLLNHVIGNLVNNAVNYTPQGDITVHLSRTNGTILFSVKDSGVGLSDDDKAVLFTEGGHGKESRSVNPHSTGYGLFIAKKIVEAHRGRIWAESEGRGKGSIFSVEVPATLSPGDFTK
jgi:signal transduction histidine kinase